MLDCNFRCTIFAYFQQRSTNNIRDMGQKSLFYKQAVCSALNLAVDQASLLILIVNVFNVFMGVRYAIYFSKAVGKKKWSLRNFLFFSTVMKINFPMKAWPKSLKDR